MGPLMSVISLLFLLFKYKVVTDSQINFSLNFQIVTRNSSFLKSLPINICFYNCIEERSAACYSCILVLYNSH